MTYLELPGIKNKTKHYDSCNLLHWTEIKRTVTNQFENFGEIVY